MDRHLEPADIDALIAGRLLEDDEEAFRAILHVHSCHRCLVLFADRLKASFPPVGALPIPPEFHRYAAALAAGEEPGRELWETRLSSLPPDKLALWLRNLDGEKLSPGLVSALLAESKRQWVRSPHRAQELSELALTILDRAEFRRTMKCVHADLTGEAHCFLGNALRILGDFAGAETQMRRGLAILWDHGSGDQGLQGTALSLLGSLKQEQTLWDTAALLYLMAENLFRQVEDRESQLTTRIKRGILSAESGVPLRAVEILTSTALDPSFESTSPGWQFAAVNSLALTLVDLGRYLEAFKCLPELRRLLAAADEPPLVAARVGWLEARIATGVGKYQAAESLYREVYEDFVRLEVPLDAGLVVLELAQLLIRLGRPREAVAPATEVLRLFRELRVHREATEALATLRQALRDATATVALVEELKPALDDSSHYSYQGN